MNTKKKRRRKFNENDYEIRVNQDTILQPSTKWKEELVHSAHTIHTFLCTFKKETAPTLLTVGLSFLVRLLLFFFFVWKKNKEQNLQTIDIFHVSLLAFYTECSTPHIIYIYTKRKYIQKTHTHTRTHQNGTNGYFRFVFSVCVSVFIYTTYFNPISKFHSKCVFILYFFFVQNYTLINGKKKKKCE